MTRRVLGTTIMSLVLVTAMTAAAPISVFSQQLPEKYLASLRYRFIGPDGNRAIAVAGEPGNPSVAYIGAASGGIFKTDDGGVGWKPVFDDQDVSSIGSLAVSQSDHNIVWAGTGETFLIRPAHSMGNGIYKSTDAGKTWRRMGLEKTGRIGRVIIHPRNPDVVYACALGHTYGPQKERGVYRSTDGGKSWQLVLHVDDNTGCNDLTINRSNPRVLFAAFWQVHINTWGLNSGGPGSGVFKTTDGGTTWKRVRGGLPGGQDHPVGKVAVDIAQSNPDRVYVLVEDSSPGFYRSDDGGEHWRLVNRNHTLDERAPYYTRFAVSPDDENRIYFASVRFSMSIDGGESIVANPPRGGGDNHDIWIDPENGDRIMVADDGGANISLNRGRSFLRIRPPIAQMYHVTTDNEIPYNVYGNRQDGYSYRGPSNSRTGGGIPLGMWRGVGGCESGFATPDPVDASIVWSGCYDGGLERWDMSTGQVRNVRVWPEAAYGWPPSELKYRWHWNFPIAISPHDHNRVYVGSQYVHMTTDGGQTWKEISPDLTLNIKEHQQSSGGIAIDNLMTFDGATLFAIAESPVQEGVIWAGTNDGQVQVTRDGGSTWENVTRNIPNLPPWGTVASVEPSHFDAGTAYIAVDLHQMGDFDPYIYKTGDFGKSWKNLSAGVPRSVLSFAHVLREDPVRPGLLFLGTDNSVYVSLDDGKTWLPFRNNMPPAPVYWLTIQPHFSDLVVATYGRGFYIMDDITPLRALSKNVVQSTAHLFSPRDTYRFRNVTGIHTEPGGRNTGRNPPAGAGITYALRDSGHKRVEISIYDAAGNRVRKIKASNRKGLNRTWWNLRYDPPARPRLRTQPPDKTHVKLGKDGTRPLVTWDLDLRQGQLGPVAAPGSYEVRLVVDDDTLTQTLTVLKDPHSRGSERDIRDQVAMLLELRDDLNGIASMIDSLEWVKKQLGDLTTLLVDTKGPPEIVSAARALADTVTGVEGHLFDVNLTGAREDAFRAPMKLYGRLSALASDLGANGADFAPTDAQREVYRVLRDRLAKARESYRVLIEVSVPRFKAMVRERKLPAVISAMEPATGIRSYVGSR